MDGGAEPLLGGAPRNKLSVIATTYFAKVRGQAGVADHVQADFTRQQMFEQSLLHGIVLGGIFPEPYLAPPVR